METKTTKGITKELAVRQPMPMSVGELRTLATDFVRSKYFQDASDVSQAVVKIACGAEMGFGPVYSMTKIFIVKGRIMVSAEALGAKVKMSGRYDYRVSKLDDNECTLIFSDNGKDVYTSTFTLMDAKRADLHKDDSGWMKWPRAMLMSKALSQGARIVCPHVIAGMTTLEGSGIEVNDDGQVARMDEVKVKADPATGEIIDATTEELPPVVDTPPADVKIGRISLDWLKEMIKQLGVTHLQMGTAIKDRFPATKPARTLRQCIELMTDADQEAFVKYIQDEIKNKQLKK